MDGKLGGHSTPSFGNISLENGDGSLDSMSAYTFDGRQITVLFASDPSTARASFTTKFEGILREGLLNERALVLEVMDNKAAMEQPVSATYRPHPSAYDFANDATRAIETLMDGSLKHEDSAWTIEFWFQSPYNHAGRAVTWGDTTAATTTNKLLILSDNTLKGA